MHAFISASTEIRMVTHFLKTLVTDCWSAQNILYHFNQVSATPPLQFTTAQILTCTLISNFLSFNKGTTVQISKYPKPIQMGDESIHNLKLVLSSPLAKADTHGKGV